MIVPAGIVGPTKLAEFFTLPVVSTEITASLITWIAPMLDSVELRLPVARTSEPPDENSNVLLRELAMLGIISQGYRLSRLPIDVS